MAKIKVHELAKEVDRQSKEVIAFLQNKGIEVKAAQSSVEDSAAEMVRQEMKKKATPKGAEAVSEPAPAVKEKGIAGPKAGEGSKPAPRTEQVKGDQAKPEPVRKKKNIIFVSNPHNSKLPQRSGTSGNGNSHNNNNNNSGGGNRRGGHNRNNNTNNNSNMNRPLIRPLTPPSPAQIGRASCRERV